MIDLVLNCITREHKDVDIILFREQQLVIQEYLSEQGWKLEYVMILKSELRYLMRLWLKDALLMLYGEHE